MTEREIVLLFFLGFNALMHLLQYRRAEMWKRFAKDYQDLARRAIERLQDWEDEP